MAKRKVTEIPKFKYHPQPFSSGALVESDEPCQCCGEARGFVYEGPAYCVDEVEQVCPWCIADGSAFAKWNASFTDLAFVDSWGDYAEVPTEVWEEIERRTPGVVGAVQAISWWVHCGEPAEFLKVEDERVRFRCRTCGKRRSYHDFD